MVWIKDVCGEVICGACVGIAKGAFGITLFTSAETEEILNIRTLALSVMEKSSEVVTDPLICEAIRKGQKSALDKFSKNASPEAVATGVVTAAQLVCTKSFNQRFTDVLMGACLNLVGC